MTQTLHDLYAPHVEQGWVTRRPHPHLPLSIYNYTPKVQWERAWTDLREQARGLIVDDDGIVVARPFKKFFNYTDVRPPSFVLTKEPIVTTKADGSLGILWQYDGHRGIATRGSFNSDQATWANIHWAETYADVVIPQGITPLFEIIYAENRIVCKYDFEGLVLLAAIDTATGADIPLWECDWWKGPRVEQHYGVKDIEAAYTLGTGEKFQEAEGIVACWMFPGKPSYRLKVKAPWYVEAHRLVTQTSTKTIWQALMEGKDLPSIIDTVPDEFYSFVKGTVKDLKNAFAEIASQCDTDYAILSSKLEELQASADRKAFAGLAKKTTYPHIMFKMLDKKDQDVIKMIWELCRPTYTRAFLNVGEDV